MTLTAIERVVTHKDGIVALVAQGEACGSSDLRFAVIYTSKFCSVAV